MRAYLGWNIVIGINQLSSYKDYWFKDLFLGNEGVNSVMTVQRYEKITEYFHVSDRRTEPAWGTRTYDKLYKVREVIVMAKKNNFKTTTNPMETWQLMRSWLNGLVDFHLKSTCHQSPSRKGSKFGWDAIQSMHIWLTLKYTLGKEHKYPNMDWERSCHTIDKRHHSNPFPCLLWQLFHKCPTDGGFVSRQNLRL